jgi:type IV pilus assembly protein PilX
MKPSHRPFASRSPKLGRSARLAHPFAAPPADSLNPAPARPPRAPRPLSGRPLSGRPLAARSRARQGGVVLVIALALLLMLTLLSVGMFRGLGLEERITGNTREKQHAFYAAQSALQYAENWLSSGNAGFGSQCSLTAPSGLPQICTLASTPSQQTLASTLWNGSFGTTYVPPTLDLNGTQTAQVTSSQYYQDPQYAITYLGADPNKAGSYLYQVTSLGFGGNANAVAVVQSVYSVGSGSQCASCAH